MHFRHLPALLVLAVFPGYALADQAAAVPQTSIIVTPIFKAQRNIAGQPIVFPKTDGEVTVTMYEFPPGAVLPIHKHPYQRLGYLLGGTLEIINEDSGKRETLRAGAVLLEAVDQWHRGRNVGKVPVRLLVIDLAPKDGQITVLKK